MIAWFTGAPAAGKTTLARRVRGLLPAPSILLDSDEVRDALGHRGYTPTERDTFYRVLGELALLCERQGLVVLVAATASHRRYREHVRARAAAFVEVYVQATAEACAARDPKGLYARAHAGEVSELPGAGVPYEAPVAPEVIADGGLDEIAAQAVARLAGMA